VSHHALNAESEGSSASFWEPPVALAREKPRLFRLPCLRACDVQQGAGCKAQYFLVSNIDVAFQISIWLVFAFKIIIQTSEIFWRLAQHIHPSRASI
jgi:hypothetical protein